MKKYGARKLTGFCHVLCLVFLLHLFPNAAKAELRQYENFSIDVPKGWTEVKETETYIFSEPNKQCVINVTMAAHQGANFNELAILLYQSLQGKSPKGDDDGFSFMIDTKSDIVSSVRFSFQDKNFVLVVASGRCNNFQDIVKTLSIKNQGSRPYPYLAPEQTLK